ncbi:uncharacterized protein LOC112053635 isoform X2 [Bicyclus anynana]|uniref:Uncharacterized protein LOC112053635 isoform X2 n=1 Tax=Bicyclus anynana TaxID=110368 RepID=A0A6J1NPS5_BICAN|nr:uncharacterized protein LOC112053635 isoform X2 [Bicyclus anynana]
MKIPTSRCLKVSANFSSINITLNARAFKNIDWAMECDRKVFSSNIIRSDNKVQNNLYDLLHIVPVQPLPENTSINTSINDCGFVPKTDKFYVPKKKNGRKVLTVRGIRNSFERDVYSYLLLDLEKQKNVLLRKIRYGSSRDEKTKELAMNMLKTDTPISKSAWQMLMNINPAEHTFSSQYILWNGKSIQINGSKGGKHKFICKYDVGKYKNSSQKKSGSKITNISKRKQLLHHSLSVKFKPGPLTKKKDLDISYQRYHFGEIDLVELPGTGLEIQPSYGKPLPPLVETFINKSFLPTDGFLTQKWAKFAVSVLGKDEKGKGVRQDEDSCVTFDLNYKCFQNRLLMRNDTEFSKISMCNKSASIPQEDLSIISEVRNVMVDVLNAVEINLKQDEMYTGEEEPREISACNTVSYSNTKNKRRKELHRLDVTVITISDSTELDDSSSCQNAYCTLGCICDSLKCSYKLKRHCGRIECMFNCKCDFSKYKYMTSLDNHNCSDIIPGLINLDKTLGQTLAKEEQKFHQTVLVTDDRSILLKSDRRNWKASKKYAEFYSKMHLKTECIETRAFSIVCPKLDCKNIEPWCMVHNLYKCFCKGKFTESMPRVIEENITVENDSALSEQVSSTLGTPNLLSNSKEAFVNETPRNDVIVTRLRRYREDSSYDKNDHVSKVGEKENDVFSDTGYICTRVLPYTGRKYKDEYYKSTNKKIIEMEENDVVLQKKMKSLIGYNTDLELIENINNININNNNIQESNNRVLPSTSKEFSDTVTVYDDQRKKRLPQKTSLVSWLEQSYKEYKQQSEKGLIKFSLEAPRIGKARLYTWEFILTRYREAQNYFLISNQKPHRIFISVNVNKAYFKDCTNISDISLSDIDKYPATVKHLLTNATDLKENFCILKGLAQCWELVGTVTKVNEKRDTQEENQIHQLMISDENDSEFNTSCDNINVEDLPMILVEDGALELEQETCDVVPLISVVQSEIAKSKWFVMKVENDFIELQFIKKGFFVKYESIVKAISAARLYGKTVRLSLQKCLNSQNDPQFGIYAIPNNENSCVFIGPYEKNENLGVETIKKAETVDSLFPESRTSGIWVITNKIDNIKVIDDPLQFIIPTCLNNDKMVALDNEASTKYNEITNDISSNIQINNLHVNKTKKTTIKQVKPIKIRKTDGFYHLTSNGCLKPIKSPKKDLNIKSLLIDSHVKNVTGTVMKKSIQTNYLNKALVSSAKPIAEIAPLIKISNADNIPKVQTKRPESGMFVLKPEEINKRSLETNILNEQPQTSKQHVNYDVNDEISMDIERFLESSVICTQPIDEIFVISDDENEKDHKVIESCKDIWIVCKNIDNLGWLPGKINLEKNISFEFPGFKSSAFYPESEAFEKITQILARKVYVPKHIELQWQVIETEAEIGSIEKLEAEYLISDYILTKNGLRHKSDLKTSLESSKNAKKIKKEKIPRTKHEESGSVMEFSLKKLKQNKIMEYLEETSQTLEDEGSFLWNETISKREAILASFSETSEEFQNEFSEQLNCILDKITDK